MRRIEVDVFVPAQEVFDLLDGFDLESLIDTVEEGDTLRLIFEGGVEVSLVVETDPGFTLVSASIFQMDDLLIDLPNIGISFDEMLTPIGLDDIVGLEIDYSGADDLVDFVGSVASFEAFFAPFLTDLDDGGAMFSFVDGTELRLGLGSDTVIFDLPANDIVERLGDDGSVSVTVDDETVTLLDIERIEVSDGAFVYDLSDEAPFVYRLYSASLARLPDEGGLRFWDGAFSDGTLTQRQLAQAFVQGREFVDNFLSDPGDKAFIEALYVNVLGRSAEGDPGGAFWLNAFQSGQLSRADMLIAFAESDENLARNAENYDDGVFVL